jgi:molecular chaperone DnaK
MSVELHLLLEKYGADFLHAALKHMAGQPAEAVRDETRYKARVAAASWRAAPMQIRMLSPDQVRWDDFCLALRDRVFSTSTGVVVLRPDWQEGVAQALRNWAPPPVGDSAHLPAADSDDSPLPASPTGQPPTQPAVGIDLGTTYSVIAYLDSQGRPTSLTNANGDILTPSVVLFDEGGTVVGKEAVLAAALEPDKVAECVKRDMGSKYFHKKINGELLPPEVISSYILRRLKADAERKLGPVSKVVITVPAYFDETRRRATMDAGRLAGLDVLDIINEPTAAAIVYGYQVGVLDRSGNVTGDRPVRVLVYDLGGGTFDVTVVEMQGQSFKALATDGDVRLGGKDWDEKLVEIAAQRLEQEIGEDPRQCPETLQDMWLAAEAAKKTLSERAKAAMYINHRGRRLKVELTRQEFEEATAPLVARTGTTADIVVIQAGLNWKDIDRVLVVGGSTRMPMIGRMLEELAGRSVDHSVSADEAVAHGAALFADLLMQKQGAGGGHAQFSVTNINSHSLGVVGIDPATSARVNKILIAKNTPLPHSAARRFRTFKAGQANVKVTVVEGESELPDACIEVGTCVIRDLPPGLPAGWPVEVRYTNQENGRLQVAAKLVGHEAKVTTEFLRDNSLSDDDLMLWGQCLSAEAMRTAE